MAYMQSMTTEANMTGCQFPQYFYHLPGGNNGMYYGESITSPPPMVMAPPTTSAFNNNNGKADNYYTVISNRIFVGSLQTEVDEAILKQNFDNDGIIRESKIIRDNAGQSKGFGFITFQDEKDAAAVLEKPSGTYCFKGRTWNVAPAMRRFNNAPREAPIPAPNLYYYSNYPGGLVRYANGMVAYPNFVPQQIYNSPSPYVNSPMLPHQFVFPPVQPHYDPNCVPAIGPVNTGVTHQLQCVQLPNDNELSSTQPSSSMPSVASETSPSVNPDDFPPLPSKGSSSERGDVRPVPNTADPAPWQSFRSKM